MEQQAKFEGWAVVELFGHAKEAGYLTTQYFGDKAMFQIDVPELKEREYTLERPEWLEVEGRDQLAPIGTKVRRAGAPGRSRIVSPSAVYAINPSTEALIHKLLDREVPRKLIVLELPKTHQIAASSEPTESPDDSWKNDHELGCKALDANSEDFCDCGAVEHEEEAIDEEDEDRPEENDHELAAWEGEGGR